VLESLQRGAKGALAKSQLLGPLGFDDAFSRLWLPLQNGLEKPRGDLPGELATLGRFDHGV
jgi:hypothetical protein